MSSASRSGGAARPARRLRELNDTLERQVEEPARPALRLYENIVSPTLAGLRVRHEYR
jgi:hypothetical protein